MWALAKPHVIAAILLLIGGLAGFAAWGITGEARALKRDGIDRPATVRTLDRKRTYNAGNKTFSTTYTVSVTFTLGSATSGELTFHRGQATVSKSFYDELERGEEITIRVLPDTPDTLEIEPGGLQSNATAAMIISAVCLLLFVGAEWLILRFRAQRRALRTRGVTVPAKVTLTHNWNGPMARVDYSAPDGQPLTAQMPRPGPKILPDLEDGGSYPLVIDPKGKHRPLFEAVLKAT